MWKSGIRHQWLSDIELNQKSAFFSFSPVQPLESKLGFEIVMQPAETEKPPLSHR
jgi:hypothetical protein